MILRLLPCLVPVTALFCFGCGKSEVADSQTPANPVAANPSNVAADPSPTDVVSQFLDQIRRGGEDSGAGQLLTATARAELKRIGREIEPIGSPDARYQVTRAEMVPGEQGSALVHSIWSDPGVDGGQSDYQVVWAVEREPVGWRISGMAIQEQEGENPIIIDFENGDLMAEVLAAPEQRNSEPANPSQAAAGSDAVAR